jgi:sodium/bile acid cotransporter 7
MIPFFARQWFLVCLALVLTFGLAFPDAAFFPWLVRATVLRNGIVATVLLMTSLVLNTRAITDAIRRPLAVSWGVLVNSAIVPLAAWPLSLLLHDDLALGLIVTAAAPCTVASAAVWTRRAGGNDAIAILVTVITNASCFLVMPLWIRLFSGLSGSPIPVGEMMLKLLYQVFLPMAIGQLLRQHAGIARWSGDRKRLLGNLSQVGILVIVLVGAINCGEQLRQTSQWSLGAGPIAWMLLVVAALHIAMLVVAQQGGRALGLPRESWIATGFAGSQKTLMVGLHVALQIGSGLTILPMVAYHVLQLLIDTLVADQCLTPPPPGDL